MFWEEWIVCFPFTVIWVPDTNRKKTLVLSRDEVTVHGFGLAIGFTEHLQIETKRNYSAMTTQQFTIARTKSSQSAMFSVVW
jgi:hypothetical protein